VAAGWVADTAHLNLSAAGVVLEPHGPIEVNRFLQTSASHVYAVGDVTGRLMLVPEAIEDGFVAATNAVQGPTYPLPHLLSPSGSFSRPEHAQVGLTEAKARETHDVVTTLVPFKAVVRAAIEGRTFRLLQACRGSRELSVSRVPRGRRASGGDHAVGGDRHRGADARGRAGACRRLLPDMRRDSVHAAIRAAVELGQAEQLRMTR
jgi:hypothetical protein